jgi:signal transduction histidine kinase
VSLRARLLAAFAYVLVLVIVALMVPLALNLSRRVDAEVKSEAQGQAQLLAAGAAGRLDNPDQLEELVDDAARRLGGRVIVVDRGGRLLVDSAGAGLRSASYATRPEIARALTGQPSQGTRHSDSLGEDLLFTALPVVRASRPAGAVRVTQSVDAVQNEVRTDVVALVAVALVVLLLGLGVAWLLAGSLAKPLRGLAGTARRVAGGDLDARARLEGSTEQREVASAFNEMTGRLARALRSQQEFVANASHQLRTPLTGLRLRLEAAALKSRDSEVERELHAAERETERLARLLAELLTLARECERPAAEPVALADVAEAARERWEVPAERSGHVRGPRRHPRQPGGERDRLLAARHDGHDRVGWRRCRPSRRARRGTRRRAGRARARVRALLPRGRRGRNLGPGPGPAGGRGARAPLGRRGDPRHPSRGRRARRGHPAAAPPGLAEP